MQHTMLPSTVLAGTRGQKLCAVNGSERFVRKTSTQGQRRRTSTFKRQRAEEGRQLLVHAEPVNGGGSISDVEEGESTNTEAVPLQPPREDDVSCASPLGTQLKTPFENAALVRCTQRRGAGTRTS